MDQLLIMPATLMVQVIEISVKQLLEDHYHFQSGLNLMYLTHKESLILELDKELTMF